MLISLVDLVLLAFLVATAWTVIRLRDLFAAVMLTGIFSLLSAGLFMAMDAVDVAFTEAAVGAGISTVLMIATLSAIGRRRERRARKHSFQLLPALVVIVTGIVLIYGTADLPSFGDPEAPIHQHMAPRFIAESGYEVGPPNIVTSVLASYRGYDTFGEATVIFTAAIGVLALLGRPRRYDAKPDTDPDRPTL